MFVTIYGRLSCPYCVRAKNLAEKLKNTVENFDYRYIDIIEQGMTKEDIAKISLTSQRFSHYQRIIL